MAFLLLLPVDTIEDHPDTTEVNQAAASDSKMSVSGPSAQEDIEKNLVDDIDTQNLEDFLKGWMETENGSSVNDSGIVL